jgi:plasmid stabilization system protein ParE
MKIRLHPGARREYLFAIKHYKLIEEGLGLRFVDAIEAGLDSIARHPYAWPAINPSVRKRVIAIFPYTILYVPRSDEALIIAVMHQSRRPDYWTSRVEE